jgi:diguanylate cyclase (GGDEF)-like protein
MPHSALRHPAALLVIAVLVIAGAIWGVSTLQRDTAERSAANASTAESMLTAMLDQETGLRGFALTRREDFIEPYARGRVDYFAALAQARRDAEGPAEIAVLRQQAAAATTWRDMAEVEIATLRVTKARVSVSDAVARKVFMDRFRSTNASYQHMITARARREQRVAGLISVAVALALAAIFGGLGMLLIRRGAREADARRRVERHYLATQQEFVEAMQVIDDEAEAHRLLKRHLERTVDDSVITVLNRNNSDDRLEAATPLGEGSSLADTLRDASPRSCVAIRLGRPYGKDESDEPLVPCTVCGGRPGTSTCQPLLVSGKVIGSVLVEHPGPLSDLEGKRIDDSVGQAAPILANLRNLAIAESRASTDALTGLANRRAVTDTLHRMVAQSSRESTPLAAITLDIDHFKLVNDRYGHDKGDEVLAAVGALLSRTVRGSDFVGRLGGEEFVVLAPDTDVLGAAVLAENLRAAVARLHPVGMDAAITASFGVCVMPDHAATSEALMRLADRALYAAKSAGRDCVRLVEAGDAAEQDPVAGASPVGALTAAPRDLALGDPAESPDLLGVDADPLQRAQR